MRLKGKNRAKVKSGKGRSKYRTKLEYKRKGNQWAAKCKIKEEMKMLKEVWGNGIRRKVEFGKEKSEWRTKLE